LSCLHASKCFAQLNLPVQELYDVEALFPLWGKTSTEVFKELMETGHKALVTSIMREKLDPTFLNREYDENYVNRLPEGIDPAGENGEFHTFLIYSPHFKMRIPFSKAIASEEGPYLVTQVKEP
jgi:diphthamide synthase (EF-2-diphthine--ammonia ligase)